jgi:hypothetical protein
MPAPFAAPRSRARYEQAVQELASWVTRGLRARCGEGHDGHDGSLVGFVEGEADRTSALAAVRIIGADVVVAQHLAGTSAEPADRAVITEALEVSGSHAPDPLLDWQEWALARAAGSSARPTPVRLPFAPEESWKSFPGRLASLAALAVPRFDGPLHEAVRERPIDIARGATRAMLRRDHPTTAALGRWLALLHVYGVALPLDVARLLTHARLVGVIDARTALDLAVAQQLLHGEQR